MFPDSQSVEAFGFWQVVEDCLREFHGMDRQRAAAIILAFKARLNARPETLSPEGIYHSEPFNLAWDLTHDGASFNDLSLYDRQYRRRYEQILEKHGWVTGHF